MHMTFIQTASKRAAQGSQKGAEATPAQGRSAPCQHPDIHLSVPSLPASSWEITLRNFSGFPWEERWRVLEAESRTILYLATCFLPKEESLPHICPS